MRCSTFWLTRLSSTMSSAGNGQWVANEDVWDERTVSGEAEGGRSGGGEELGKGVADELVGEVVAEGMVGGMDSPGPLSA